MDDQPSREGPHEIGDSGIPDRQPMPRWVRILLIVGAALAVVAIGVAVLGGGDHGPGRHQPGGNEADVEIEDPGGHEPPPGVDH